MSTHHRLSVRHDQSQRVHALDNVRTAIEDCRLADSVCPYRFVMPSCPCPRSCPARSCPALVYLCVTHSCPPSVRQEAQPTAQRKLRRRSTRCSPSAQLTVQRRLRHSSTRCLPSGIADVAASAASIVLPSGTRTARQQLAQRRLPLAAGCQRSRFIRYAPLVRPKVSNGRSNARTRCAHVRCRWRRPPSCQPERPLVARLAD